ncbi:MAG: heavy-metal-associated domain-containing protein [Verrucomicrobia bacterium]|nr:heavy-metal-associated domain-containing protein [Verrucomicrobiota bacterium]
MKLRFLFSAILGALVGVCVSRAADAAKDDDVYAPHTPTLIFYLTGVTGQPDADAISNSVAKLPSVRKVNVNAARGFAQVRFDSYVVSYHQVAQAIADAGKAVGKKFDPRLKIRVPEYAQAGNAAKVDVVFAGKRLNQRVTVKPVDKSQGEFLVHFLPLELDPAETGPQGFNGGHLNHPIHDAPPRGLGLTCIYAAEDH